MNKSNKILTILLVAQVALLLGMRLSTDDKKNRRVSVDVLPGVDIEQVEGLEIFGAPKKGDGPDQEHVNLAKKDGAWGLADADGYPADGEKVLELLTKLTGLTSRTTVLSGSKYHDKLEVSETVYQRKVVITANGETKTLFFGSAPSFKNVHVRQGGSDAVLLINDFGNNDLGQRAWSWVDRKFHDVPDDQVWQVKLQNKKGEIQLDRDPASRQWAALGVADADTAAITEIVNKARSVSLEMPLGKAVKPEYGFAAPLAVVTLTTGTSTIAGAPPETTSPVKLEVGAAAPGTKKEYFVKSSLSPYVVKVSEFTVKALIDKGPGDLVKKPPQP